MTEDHRPVSGLRLVLAVALAILATSHALPGGSAPILIWLALSPLAWAIWQTKPRHTASLAFLYGFVSWSLAIPGWANAAQAMFGLPPTVACALMLALAALQAFPFAIAGYLTAALCAGNGSPGTAHQWCARVLGFATAGTVALSWLPGILPGSPAHALYRDPAALQLLTLGGAPLLLFALLLVNALFADALLRRTWRPLLMAAGLIAAIYGGGRLNLAWTPERDGQSLRIAGIQPAIGLGDHAAWALPGDRARALNHLAAMTESAASMLPPPDLIVWPELPIVIAPQQEPAIDEWLAALARRVGRPIVVSGAAASGMPSPDGVERVLARAWLYNSQGVVAGHHDKARLVPFAEYLPLEDFLPGMRRLFPFADRYRPGGPAATVAVGNGISVIVAICYEASFAGDMRAQARAGGMFILNPVNDHWFGKSRLRDLHLATVSFRAVELGIPVVRVANSGQTAFIAPSGRFDAAAYPAADRPALAAATMSASRADTFYARFGDMALWLLTGGLALALARLYRAKLKPAAARLRNAP